MNLIVRLSILLLVFLFGLSACFQNQLDFHDEQMKLNRFKRIFNDSLWIGFPEKVNSSTRVLFAYNPAVLKHNMNYYGIFIEVNCTESESYQDLVLDLKEQAIKIYSITDIIEKKISENTSTIKLKNRGVKDDAVDGIDYVIPDIEEQLSPLKDKYTNGSQLYLFDTSFGLFNENEYLKYSKTFSENGISRGVLLDYKGLRIIYWIILW